MSDEIKPAKSIQQLFMPLLVLVTIGLAFFGGTMYQKVKNLEKGQVAGTTAQDAQKPTAQPTVEIGAIKDLFGKDLIKFGNDKSKVLFVEVSDPSCPFCQIAGGKNIALIKDFDKNGTYVAPVPEMRKLVESGKASYVLIYSPGHGNGEMGMKALYCAFDQNKFWQASDLIMADAGYTLLNDVVKNDKTQSQKIADFLKDVLDGNELKKCLDSGKYDERITSDQQLSTSLGIAGTPAFFVNTTLFAGAYSFKDMESAVTDALK
jgi:protein-disulfide isomerase